jgi:hypothetical protein
MNRVMKIATKMVHPRRPHSETEFVFQLFESGCNADCCNIPLFLLLRSPPHKKDDIYVLDQNRPTHSTIL